ncbi:hypothetical protein D3C85_1260620 [compost metagenome]
MAQLRHKGGRPPQVGVDLVIRHGGIEWPQALCAATLGCVAHNLCKLNISQHDRLFLGQPITVGLFFYASRVPPCCISLLLGMARSQSLS